MVKKIIVRILYKNPLVLNYLISLHQCLFPIRGKGNKVIKSGYLINSKISIIGNDNKIFIAPGCVLKNVEFHVRGDNHIIQIDEKCKIHEWGSIWCEGENNTISIGRGTTIVSAHLCAQEKNTQIKIGSDCMLSNNIQIRTSDSHPYYEIATKKRLNEPKSVNVGDHVWICAKATIMKGVTIQCGSIIGYSSIITKDVFSNTLVTGSPARVIKENICWDRRFNDVSSLCDTNET